MRQATIRSILYDVVDEKMFLVDFQLMEEAVAFPHEAADRRLAADRVEDELLLDPDPRFVSKIAASERAH